MAAEVTNYQMMSSPALAFLGDAVFELNIRAGLVREGDLQAEELNRQSKALTNAKSQAKMADQLQNILTAEELAVYKRGRNHKSVTAPKSCSISEYRRATGLEALMGYLFLEKKQQRIDELIRAGIEAITNDEEQ